MSNTIELLCLCERNFHSIVNCFFYIDNNLLYSPCFWVTRLFFFHACKRLRVLCKKDIFSKMKTPGNIVKREYFYVCVRHVTFFLSVMRGWVWPSFGWVWPFIWVWVGVGECNHFLAGCGRLWPFVTFSWLGVGECGWVWPFSGWVLVGVGECAFFLAGCGWVWVGVIFFWLGVCGCG